MLIDEMFRRRVCTRASVECYTCGNVLDVRQQEYDSPASCGLSLESLVSNLLVADCTESRLAVLL